MTEVGHFFWTTFFHGKSRVLILAKSMFGYTFILAQKRVWLHFGRFFFSNLFGDSVYQPVTTVRDVGGARGTV
jgi:hypothetical protein